MNAKYLGANIKKYRMAQGMTQDYAAEKCSLSPNYFRQIELGNKIPRLETFLKIAEVLDVPTDFLLCNNLSREHQIRTDELYKRIENLPDKKKRFILNTMENLIEEIKDV